MQLPYTPLRLVVGVRPVTKRRPHPSASAVLRRAVCAVELLEGRRLLSAFPSVVSISRNSPDVLGANGVNISYAVTFSEAVTGVDATDFAVAKTGNVAAGAPVVVSGTGAAYTVTVNAVTGTGTVGLNLVDDNSIRDLAGHPLVRSSGSVSFAAEQTFATDKEPIDIAVADVNGDGKPDLVTANYANSKTQPNGSASVLLGNGNGTFGAQQSFATGRYPFSVVVADVNGDGRPDVITANYGNNTLGVMLGNGIGNKGDGTFAAEQTFAGGQYNRHLAVADVNGDGNPDLITTDEVHNTLNVLLGNGNGTFKPQQTFAAASGAYSVAVADVNHDNHLDLITADEFGKTANVLLGNGNGSFAPQQTFATGIQNQFVSVADVNGDGIPDLITTRSGASTEVSVLLGNGNGTFAAPQSFAIALVSRTLVVADVNGDGTPDLVLAVYSNGETGVLLGNGNGTFQAPQTFAADPGAQGLAVGDVNGDGRADIVTSSFSKNSVSVLLASNGSFTGQPAVVLPAFPHVVSINHNTPDAVSSSGVSVSFTVTFSTSVTGVDASDFALAKTGTLTVPTPLVVAGSGAVYTVTADSVTNTGTLGLNLTDNNSIRDAAGQPLVQPAAPASFGTAQTFAIGTNEGSIAVADLNGDGIPDLISSNQTSAHVSILLGSGSGTFGAEQTFATGQAPAFVAVADVNGDGKPDLVAANYVDKTASVLLGNGNGTFGVQKTFAIGLSFFLTVADVNGDGKPDLVCANYGFNTVSILAGNGDGTFGALQTVATGTAPYGVAVADVTGDGSPDLITPDFQDNTVSVIPEIGNGAFGARQTFATVQGPRSLVVADVNGDGKPDLIVGGFSGLGVLLGNGNGTFAPQQTVAVGSIRQVAVADVNGDGKLDLITTGGAVGVLLGNGNGTFVPQQTFANGINAQPLTVADVNQDGRLDIVTAGTNSVSVLPGLGNGGFIGQVDTILPRVLTITRASPAGPNTALASVSYAVTFNTPVTGVDATDFVLALTGSVAAGSPVVVTGSGASYTVTVNGIVAGVGTLELNLVNNNSIQDMTSQPLSDTSVAGPLYQISPVAIESLSFSPNPVTRGNKLTVTANNITATTGDQVKSIIFFLDTNHSGTFNKGDVRLGTVSNGRHGFSVTFPLKKVALGQLAISAIAIGKKGNADVSTIVTGNVTVADALPQIKKLQAMPSHAKVGGKLKLVVLGATDKDGTVAKVDFFQDTNHDGVLDIGTDLLLGSDLTRKNGFSLNIAPNTFSAGMITLFAVATDNDGGASNVATLVLTEQ